MIKLFGVPVHISGLFMVGFAVLLFLLCGTLDSDKSLISTVVLCTLAIVCINLANKFKEEGK